MSLWMSESRVQTTFQIKHFLCVGVSVAVKFHPEMFWSLFSSSLFKSEALQTLTRSSDSSAVTSRTPTFQRRWRLPEEQTDCCADCRETPAAEDGNWQGSLWTGHPIMSEVRRRLCERSHGRVVWRPRLVSSDTESLWRHTSEESLLMQTQTHAEDASLHPYSVQTQESCTSDSTELLVSDSSETSQHAVYIHIIICSVIFACRKDQTTVKNVKQFALVLWAQLMLLVEPPRGTNVDFSNSENLWIFFSLQALKETFSLFLSYKY